MLSNDIDSSLLPEGFKISEILGQSQRNVVMKAITPIWGEVVMKISPIGDYYQREICCLQACQHENIVKILASFTSERGSCMILEKLEGKNLVSFLQENGPCSEIQAKKMIKQIVEALFHIHSKGYAHRDVKGDNIIFDSTTGIAKLIDFEFSCKVRLWSKHRAQVGTLEYSPPEVRKGKTHGQQVDVWSLGVTIFSILTGCFPFRSSDLRCGNEVLRIPENLSLECRDLLKKMLEENVNKRISMKQVLNHPWFSSSRSESLSVFGKSIM